MEEGEGEREERKENLLCVRATLEWSRMIERDVWSSIESMVISGTFE